MRIQQQTQTTNPTCRWSHPHYLDRLRFESFRWHRLPHCHVNFFVLPSFVQVFLNYVVSMGCFQLGMERNIHLHTALFFCAAPVLVGGGCTYILDSFYYVDSRGHCQRFLRIKRARKTIIYGRVTDVISRNKACAPLFICTPENCICRTFLPTQYTTTAHRVHCGFQCFMQIVSG